MPRITAEFLQDPGLQRILSMLQDAGHQALIVGGAVRNALMGAPVADVDLTTSATPDQVSALASRAGLRMIPTGIDHGTVTLLDENGRGYEITTFRRDVKTDGRRASIAFSTDLEQDARRRDFTINALYATADGTVLDPIGGLPDLRVRRLRFVGDPHARIAEDYLRILRFFRFHAWYGTPGGADEQALAAIRDLAPGIARLSRERLGTEMRRLLSAPDPSDALRLMAQSEVLELTLPGADPTHIPALIAAEEDLAPPDWLLRLACLGPDDPRHDLRLSNAEAAALSALHRDLAAGTPLPRVAWESGTEPARRLAMLRLSQGQSLPPDWTEAIEWAYRQKFPLKAADLMPAVSGPALGHALNHAKDYWIRNDFRPAHGELKMIAQKAAQELPQKLE